MTSMMMMEERKTNTTTSTTDMKQEVKNKKRTTNQAPTTVRRRCPVPSFRKFMCAGHVVIRRRSVCVKPVRKLVTPIVVTPMTAKKKMTMK